MSLRQRLAIITLAILAFWCGKQVPTSARSQRPEVEKVETWTLDRDGVRGLRLLTHGGNIRVLGGSGDRLQIRATRKSRGESEAAARAVLDQIRIDRRRDGDRWVVEATWPERLRSGNSSPHVDLEARLPRGIALEALTGGGNMELSGVGDSRLRTGGGNVHVNECAGPLAVETGGGNLELRQIRGTVKARTGGGNIHLDGRTGPVELQTGGGNIQIEAVGMPVAATTGGGNIDARVTGGDADSRIELQTGSGNIALRLPASVSARVQAETGSGQVRMEPGAGARYNEGRSRLEAVLGEGQGRVHLRTGSGNVQIVQSGSR